MKHVLVIAYEFPPAATSGVFRIVKFVRHLREAGWRSSVLTVDPRHAWLPAQDDALLTQIPQDTVVLRAHCSIPRALFPRDHNGSPRAALSQSRPLPHWLNQLVRGAADVLLVPDAKIFWYPDAIRQGAGLVARDRPDVVLSSSPRETAHLIAMRLTQQHGIPWVADFRDPWTGAFFKPARAPLLSHVSRRLERLALQRADRITTAWQGLTDDLLRRHPACPPSKITTIYNGYDPTDFDATPHSRSASFSLVHAGVFIPREAGVHPLLDALCLWLREKPEQAGAAQVRLLGRCCPSTMRRIREHGLQGIVTLTGHVPHAEAVRTMQDATALFFLNPFGEARHNGAVAPGEYVPGKLFEYLASGRPILGVAQPGSASAGLLGRCGRARVVPSPDPRAICDGLIGLHDDWAAGRLPSVQPCSDFSEFDRRVLTRKLATVLHEAMASSHLTVRDGGLH